MARYGYFWGCYVPGRLPHVEKSTKRVMDALGVECVELDGLTCCPEKSMIRNMDEEAWLATAARNLCLAEAAGVDFVTPCPGCFGTLRGAAAELAGQPKAREETHQRLEAIGRRYRGRAGAAHILEVLHDEVGLGKIRERVERPLDGMRIAVHYGCHLLKPSPELAFDDPAAPSKFDALVEALGATSVGYRTKLSCCGGLLSRVGDMETSQAMAREKLRDVTEEGADAICLACPACMMQYDGTQLVMQRRGEDLEVPVLYYTELLGLALGLEADELGLSAHRVAVSGFLEKWEARRGEAERARQHWEYDLLRACAECGACESDCPVAGATGAFEPNAIIRRLAEGKVSEVLEAGDFWRCVECYTCREMCFQRYSMLDIFRVAKHLAVEQGLAPAGTGEGMQAFSSKGRLVEGSASQRKRLGLGAVRESGGEELARLLGDEAAKEQRG